MSNRLNVVRVTKREKRACKACEEQGVQAAPLPNRIIDKGLASDRVVIDAVVSKSAHHLPLYRQSAILERETGLELSRATLDGWVRRPTSKPTTCAVFSPNQTDGPLMDGGLHAALVSLQLRRSRQRGHVRAMDPSQLVPPRQVRLFGKGKKERLLPLWRETTDALHRLRGTGAAIDQQHVFVNRPVSR